MFVAPTYPVVDFRAAAAVVVRAHFRALVILQTGSSNRAFRKKKKKIRVVPAPNFHFVVQQQKLRRSRLQAPVPARETGHNVANCSRKPTPPSAPVLGAPQPRNEQPKRPNADDATLQQNCGKRRNGSKHRQMRRGPHRAPHTNTRPRTRTVPPRARRPQNCPAARKRCKSAVFSSMRGALKNRRPRSERARHCATAPPAGWPSRPITLRPRPRPHRRAPPPPLHASPTIQEPVA